MAKGKTHIGTSGWNYKHWIGTFYPEGLKPKDWLAYYISKGLHTIELNSSFYRLPPLSTFEKWNNQVPEGFFFSVKANRYITHLKRLLEPEEPVDSFITNAKGLKKKLGPILFQLPPGLKSDIDRLAHFLKILPRRRRYTFEFRNSSWWVDDTYKLLKKYNCAFCLFELAGQVTPKVVTANYIYIRLHGPAKGKYQGKYSTETLRAWADDFKKWNREGKDVYCYFDNDQLGYAAQNAIEINNMI